MGFPLAAAPTDKEVATGMVRTMVPVPVVMALRFWMGVGVFTAEVCTGVPAAATLAGRADDFVPMSCRLKLSPCSRLLAEAAPWRALAGWACMQWVLLATSLLCRAWKALGVVLLGMAADGAGLTELSAAEPSLEVASSPKGSFPPDTDWLTAMGNGFPATTAKEKEDT